MNLIKDSSWTVIIVGKKEATKGIPAKCKHMFGNQILKTPRNI